MEPRIYSIHWVIVNSISRTQFSPELFALDFFVHTAPNEIAPVTSPVMIPAM